MSARIAGIVLWLLAAVAASAQAQTVEYLHTDALGSVVAVTNASRTVLERREYEPYGSQLTPAVSNGPGYTGHVQDAATGIVYMQQRYYDAQIGLFLSVDPVTPYDNPVSQFHRYRYANNSPYGFKDPDGGWPTKIHEDIIDQAFPGLTDQQRQVMKTASARMDQGVFSQTKKNNHEHFMKSPGEDPQKATAGAKDSIRRTVEKAKAINAGDTKRPRSLSTVGQAVHTATDGTSPAHVDQKGNPRVWNGLPVSLGDIEAIKQHGEEEASISPAQMKNAVEAAREVYKAAYGSALCKTAAKTDC